MRYFGSEACGLALVLAIGGLAPVHAAWAQAAAEPASAAGVTPDAVHWTVSPQVPGTASAVVVGNPAKPGLYILLGKMEPGAVFPSHKHPDQRVTTVLSGTMYYGRGPAFDPKSAQPYPAGSIVPTPPGVAHYMWAKDGAMIVQETGYGPSGLAFTPEQ